MSALQPEYLAAGCADERVCSILLLLQDNNERTTGEESLQAIYEVDRAPSDTALRAVLEEMSVEKMGGGNMLRIIRLLVGIQFKIKMWECCNLFIKFCNANVFEVPQLCTQRKNVLTFCAQVFVVNNLLIDMITPKLLTRELLHELLSVTEAPCISLYMPTHRSHPENIQDTIRYKNLVKQVNESLSSRYPAKESEKLLAPLMELAANNEFWNHTSNGLAVLCAPGLFKVFHLQAPIVEELAIVANSFHTKPLRHYLQSADRYQVLSLKMDAIRFYEGNRHSLVEIELPDDFPKTIAIALGEELTEEHVTVASYGGVSGESANMHHGHGGKKDEVGNDNERFFRVVAGAVYDSYSKPGGLPLLLAALPEHHYLFNQVNKNPFVLSQGVEINPQSVSVEKLAELSWEVMQPLYLKKLEMLAGKFNQAKSDGLGSDNIDEVIEAAEAGRVDTLFIEAHRVIAGRLRNKVTGRFKMTDLTQPVLDDQLDDIGLLVYKMGGTVVIIPQDQMPSHTGLAAIFRY